MQLKNKSLVSIKDLNKESINRVLELAKDFEENHPGKILDNYVVSTIFFEPSTRTRLSFESAANRIGARVLGFSDTSNTSLKKGESFHDTIKMIESYSNLIVVRHPNEGSAKYAKEISSVPIINAGDGANQHPTQTLLDLYSIFKTQKKIDDITIAFVGDLKYGRTVHSLVHALLNYKNIKFYFISPEELKMPREIIEEIKEEGLDYEEKSHLDEIIPQCDIVYMTRIQKERFSDMMEYEKVKNTYVLKANMLSLAKDNMKILHPLPRVNEIDTDVDNTKYAYYFEQAKNGVYVREALLALILGVME